MSEDVCPKCGVRDRLKPRWFGVPRYLFILNGRVRARGAAGGSHRVYGWEIQRVYYPTMFGRSIRHRDFIVCPDSWHELPLGDATSESYPYKPRIHKTPEERRAKKLAKRARSDKR